MAKQQRQQQLFPAPRVFAPHKNATISAAGFLGNLVWSCNQVGAVRRYDLTA